MSNPQGALKHEGKHLLVRRSEIAPKTKRKACNIGGLVETAYILRTGTHLRTGNFTHLRTDTANKWPTPCEITLIFINMRIRGGVGWGRGRVGWDIHMRTRMGTISDTSTE